MGDTQDIFSKEVGLFSVSMFISPTGTYLTVASE